MPDTADHPASDTAENLEPASSQTVNNMNEASNFFERLEACLPPVAMVDGSDTPEKGQSTTNYSCLIKQLLIRDSLVQKSELELLKEKIMKLEERNNELEKKLTSNVFNSKENSLNDSFSLNLDDLSSSGVKVSLLDPSKQQQQLHQLPLNTNLINSFINNSNPTSISSNSSNILINGCNSSATKASLKSIPNINQGGFIITSTGSISYVPPSNATSTPNAKLPPTTSSLASSSANTNSDAHLPDNQLKFELDSFSTANYQARNSINLDLSSLFSTGKNLLNLNVSSKTSPSVSPNKTAPVDKQLSTAFILSANGQLVPITNPVPAPTPSSSSSMPYILPKPTLLPKPSTTPVIAPKPAKNTKPNKSKSIKSKPVTTPAVSSSNTDSTKPTEPQPILIVPAAATLTPTPPSITTTMNTESLSKHRAIRPKPIAPAPFNSKHKAIVPKPPVLAQPQVFVLPAHTSPSATSYGIIKIETISPGKALMETNDILSKAASMIFSPSEFTLNNLSPSANTSANTPATNNPNTSPGTFLLHNPSNSEATITPPGKNFNTVYFL